MIRKIAVLTSGGDSPGMNSAVRAVIKAAVLNKMEPYVVYEGYEGLCKNKIEKASLAEWDSFINKGGSKIYSYRYPEFKNLKVRKIAIENLRKIGIEALIVIGGDGSYQGAIKLSEMGLKTIALPGTIDNDISSTDFTIGFFTALESIVTAIDKIRDTANSHRRAMIVEVMGRYCGDLAMYSAMASGVELVITPDKKLNIKAISDIVTKSSKQGDDSTIIIVTEKMYDVHEVAKKVEEATGIVTRANILGYIQRGGIPAVMDRILATEMGLKAIELLKNGKTGLCVCYKNGKIDSIKITDALKIKRNNLKRKIELVNNINILK